MPKIDSEIVQQIIDVQIAQKTASKRRVPANVEDHNKWERAKLEAKKQYGDELKDDRLNSVVSHIYQNMGGRFANKQGQKNVKMPEDSSETKKRDDSHECPVTGDKLKKSPESDQKWRTKPNWTKYTCPDTGYSKDFRDGAPIYQAVKLDGGWGFFESNAPLFALEAKDVTADKREAFLSENHGKTIVKEMAAMGPYEYVRKWFRDGEGVTIIHPGLRLAAMGIDEPVYKLIARDVLTNTDYKKSGSKARVASDLYSDLKQYASDLAKADAKRKQTIVYLGPGKLHTAQGGPVPGDVSVAEPKIEETATGGLGGQAGPGMVDPEVSEKLTGDTKDYSSITEAVGDVVAAIVSNSDAISTEEVLTELKTIFVDDDEFARFRGKIEEKVEGDKGTEEQAGEVEEAPPASQSPAGDSAHPEPQVVAAVKKAQKWETYARQVWAVKESVEKQLLAAKAQLKTQNDLEEELDHYKQVTRRLLIERSARIRAPRAVRMAQKMFDVGELGEGDRDALVREALDVLMTMKEDSFMTNENRINRIYEKMHQTSSRRSIVEEEESTGGQSILSFVPVTTQKEERDFLGKRHGSSNIEANYPWSRGSTVRRV